MPSLMDLINNKQTLQRSQNYYKSDMFKQRYIGEHPELLDANNIKKIFNETLLEGKTGESFVQDYNAKIKQALSMAADRKFQSIRQTFDGNYVKGIAPDFQHIKVLEGTPDPTAAALSSPTEGKIWYNPKVLGEHGGFPPVYAHELDHFRGDSYDKTWATQQAGEWIKGLSKDKVENASGPFGLQTFNKGGYWDSPTEIRAYTQGLREALYKAIGYDSTKPFTEENYNQMMEYKAKNKINNLGGGLLEALPKDQLMQIMNSVAQNEQGNSLLGGLSQQRTA